MVKKKNTKKRKASKKSREIEKHNKILKWFFSIFLLIVLLIVGYYASSYYITNFEYEGLEFKIIKEGDIIFYNTFLNLEYKGAQVEYNFYLRNDPRKLKEIPFEGDLLLLNDIVLNMTEEFHCEGDGVISIANLANLYRVVGINLVRDENASCDDSARYQYLNIQPGDETRIEKTGEACYQIYISDCEILEGTERFLLDSLVKLDDLLESSSI